jgi:hypothetical protein
VLSFLILILVSFSCIMVVSAQLSDKEIGDKLINIEKLAADIKLATATPATCDTKTLQTSLDEIKKGVSTPSLTVHGTEYFPNDPATIFLQLNDNQGNPISNGLCYLDIYSPLSGGTHSALIQSAPMFQINSSNGLYYYDMFAPSTIGVYMLSAKCSYAYQTNMIYTDGINSPVQTVLNGTYTGSTVNLISNKDGLYQKCVSQVINVTTTINGSLPYGWWHLNENSGVNVFDSSSNNRNGTTINSPSWVAGKLNSALQFNGANQYVNFTNISVGDFERNQSFSTEFWFKTSNTGTQIFISKMAPSGNYNGWEVWYEGTSTNRMYFDLFNNAASNAIRVYFINSTISDNAWHHLIVTYDGSSSATGVKFYYDGALKSTIASSDSLSLSTSTSAPFQISGRGNGATGTTGILDEIVIYNKVLSQSDITFRYNNGAGTENPIGDISSYSNQICSATYDYNTSLIISNLSSVNSASLYYAGESTGTNPLNFSIWNWTSGNWGLLPNSLIFHATANSVPTGVDEYVTNNINNPSDYASNGMIRIKLTSLLLNTTNSVFTQYDNWLNINLVSSSGTIQQVRGSSEMHVSNPNVIATAVWNYTGTVNDNILSQFTNSIWSYTSLISSSIINAFASGVWNYNPRNLTNVSFEGIANVNVTQIWEFQNASIANIKDMSVTFIGQTEYIPNDEAKIIIRLIRGTGSLTVLEPGATCNITVLYPNQTYFADHLSMTEFGEGVYYYNFTAPLTLGVYTYYTGCVVEDRNYYSLNTFHISDSVNKTAITEDVWGAVDRNLTYYPPMNITVNVTMNITTNAINVTVGGNVVATPSCGGQPSTYCDWSIYSS